MENKFCPMCQLSKNITEFSKWTRAQDGLNMYCRTCQSVIAKQAYQRKLSGIKLRLSPKVTEELFINGLKLCRKCNQTKSLLEFSNCKTLTHNKGKYCKECMKAYHHSLNGRYSTYKTMAKKKQRIFQLSIDEFDILTKSKCVYCGSIGVNGIDRVDNNIGYVSNNCITCCKICNFMKEDKSFVASSCVGLIVARMK